MPETIVDAVEATEEIQTTVSAWEGVEVAILKHHHKPDLQAARILYSAVAAHCLPGAPVWPMLVAPPGSMKTELVNGMDGLKAVHFIDSLTPKSFISGQLEEGMGERRQPASLLHRIGSSGIIVYPDFSTILGMKHEDKATILADMRRIYDGKLSKQFGTAENMSERTWEGRLTFVVAVTPAIDGYYSVFQTLGERFVMVRWPRAGGIETGLAAINQDNTQAKADIKAAVHNLLGGSLRLADPVLSPDMQVRLAALAEIAVRGRTHIPRTGFNKDIIYVPEAESNTRLAQQLAQLAKGSALLDGRAEVNEQDFSLVKRAAFDCMPPVRKLLLEALRWGEDPALLNVPPSTRTYALEELEAQGLVERKPSPRLSTLAREMLEMAGVGMEVVVL
jgi:hypothetical protein